MWDIKSNKLILFNVKVPVTSYSATKKGCISLFNRPGRFSKMMLDADKSFDDLIKKRNEENESTLWAIRSKTGWSIKYFNGILIKKMNFIVMGYYEMIYTCSDTSEI